MILAVDGDPIMVVGSPMRDYKSRSMGMEVDTSSIKRESEFLGQIELSICKDLTGESSSQSIND